MSTTESQIRERVESFVKELEALIRQAAVTAVADVLGVGARPAKSSGAPAAKAASTKAASAKAAPRVGRPAAPAAKPVAKKAGRPGRPPGSGAGKAKGGSKKRVRRTLKELDAVGIRIHEFVQKNPGLRAEQIKKSLKLGANDWALPIKKLVDERSIVAKGQKRATTYSAK